MDIATLAVRIDSSQAKRAAGDLNRFRGAAGRAEGAATRLGVANDNVARSTAVMGRGFQFALRALAPLGAALTAAFSVTAVFAFKDALAEVSTLVDTTAFNMRELETAALQQAAAFGSSPAQQVKAFYQIISAGAGSAAEATEILTAANKLAVGGVTDIATAADGLTSVLNAYGDRVEGAGAVSDALFVAMRAGKTTIGELSGALGRVAPIAAQTGVSFDELAAAVSALTKGGISTAEAVTGVRAILAAVAKPTSEASKLAAQLGIDFTATGLSAKGLAGFMDDLVKRTGGSTEALAQLFGGVEALIPVMALSGQAGADFATILGQMDAKAGATEDAFTKMANSPGFQSRRLWASLQAEIAGVGGVMSGVLVDALRLLADNMSRIVGLAKVIGAALLAAFGPTVVIAVGRLTVAIARGLVGAIRAVGIAIATNPLGALVVAITTIITAAYVFRDDIKRIFGIDVIEAAKVAGNALIGAFVGAYDLIKSVWMNLPDLVGGVAKLAANRAITEFNELRNNIRTGLGLEEDPVGLFGGMKFDLSASEREALSGAARAFGDAMDRDYIGRYLADLADSSGSAAESIAAIGAAASGAAGPLGGLSKEAQKQADAYAEIVRSARQAIAAEELEQRVIGMTAEAANRLRYEQELLNRAANDNIALTPTQTAELGRLAAGMAAAEAATEALHEAQKRAQESVRFAADITKGAVSDLRSGLAAGESAWESFGNAATGALERITPDVFTLEFERSAA
jgi:TP901 family phage tail tape measure protein